MLSAEGEPFLGLDGAPPERTIYLSLFQDSGLHRQGADGGAFAFSEPSKDDPRGWRPTRSEEHTSELQSLMRISYAVFCLKKKKKTKPSLHHKHTTTRKHTHNTKYS